MNEWSTDNQSIITEEKGHYVVVKVVVLVLYRHLLLLLLLFEFFLYFCFYNFILFRRVTSLRPHPYPWVFLQILRFDALFSDSQRWRCHFLLDKLIFEKLNNFQVQSFPLPKQFKDILFVIPHILLIKILSNRLMTKPAALPQVASFVNVIKLAWVHLGIVRISALLFGASSR